MPFKSEAQRRYLWMAHPDIAERWAHGEHSSKGPHKMPKRNAKRKTKRR